MKSTTKHAGRSTSKLKDNFSTYSEHPAISFFVSAKSLRQIDRLADWLNRRKRETAYSFPEIARRSGGAVSQGTVANVANKVYESVDAKTVRGLAKAFDVTEQELWDIVNGVTVDFAPSLEAREISLPASLWRLLDIEAARCKRGWDQHFEAILSGYFGSDVNIDIGRLAETRQSSVIVIPLDEGAKGEVPFTSVSPAKKNPAKRQASKKNK